LFHVSLANFLLDHASRILILAKRDKLRRALRDQSAMIESATEANMFKVGDRVAVIHLDTLAGKVPASALPMAPEPMIE
jgi:hypothetical protein